MTNTYLLPKMQYRYAGHRKLIERRLAEAEAKVRVLEQWFSLKAAEAAVYELKRDLCDIILLQNGVIDCSDGCLELYDENGELCY
jgi:hypothetical protein